MEKKTLFYASSPGHIGEVIEKLSAIAGETGVSIQNMGHHSTKERLLEYRHMLIAIWMKKRNKSSLVFVEFNIEELFADKIVSFSGIQRDAHQDMDFLDALGLLYDRLITYRILVMGPWPVNGYIDDTDYELFGIAGGDEHPPVGHIEEWTQRIRSLYETAEKAA